MKKLLILFIFLNSGLLAQSLDEEKQKLHAYLLENSRNVKEINGKKVVELDGVICRILVGGWSPIPECGTVKGTSFDDSKAIQAVLNKALGKKNGAGINCRQLIDLDTQLPLGDSCGPMLNLTKDDMKVSEDQCRFLQKGLMRVHRPQTRSCSKDSSICIGTIQCKGQGPSTAACAPVNGECSQTADECVDDKEVQLYKKYGMGLPEEEEPMGKSSKSSNQ